MPIRFGGSYGSASSSPSYYDFLAGTANSALPTGVTLTRASSATRRNSSGYIETISTDVPAWQYAVGGTARGLRVFGSVTNQIKQATTITGTSTSFAEVRSSLSAAAATSPDGTVNAAKVVEDTTASYSHYVYIAGMSVTAAAVYTISVYAKAAERSWLCLSPTTTNGFVSVAGTAYFNLGTGATGTVTNATAGIEDAGSGWYRCWVTVTADGTTADARILFMTATGNGSNVYTGDGTSGLYLWGAQFEAGNGPTSFIPTTTATVTRAADTALITSGYPLVDQTWVIRARTAMFTPSGIHVLFQVDDGSNNNRRMIYRDSSNQIRVEADLAGVAQCNHNLGVVANDTDFVVACRWADNNFAASLNGGAIVTDLVGTNPLGLTTARIGAAYSSSVYWQSTIRTIETRRTATDAELPLLCL